MSRYGILIFGRKWSFWIISILMLIIGTSTSYTWRALRDSYLCLKYFGSMICENMEGSLIMIERPSDPQRTGLVLESLAFVTSSSSIRRSFWTNIVCEEIKLGSVSKSSTSTSQLITGSQLSSRSASKDTAQSASSLSKLVWMIIHNGDNILKKKIQFICLDTE